MNILAIDYGKKRIGLAWMQEGIDVVLPFGKIQDTNSKIQIEKLVLLVRQEKIDLLVVGMPIGLDGKENENTARVREFGASLAKESGLRVEYIDERFTTSEAHRMGGDASADEKSAMLMLEAYHKNKKI